MRMCTIQLFSIVIVMSSLAIAQFKTKITVRNESSGSDVIPDPKRKLSLASLLAHPSVTNSLELSKDQSRVVSDALKANHGSFDIPVFSRTGDQLPTKDEIDLLKERHHENSSKLLDEVLTPTQWERLRQIAYQIEVSRLGLGDAIAYGRLGREIGITENQITNIREKASRIQRKAEVEIIKILFAAQNELLAELSTEQREKAKDCLGTPFVFRDDLGRGSRSQTEQ